MQKHRQPDRWRRWTERQRHERERERDRGGLDCGQQNLHASFSGRQPKRHNSEVFAALERAGFDMKR